MGKETAEPEPAHLDPIAAHDIVGQHRNGYLGRHFRTVRVSSILEVALYSRPLFRHTERRMNIAQPALLKFTAEKAIEYLEGVDTRPVVPTLEDLARLSELGGPLPDTPSEPHEVIELLHRVGSPGTATTAGGRYFGFVNGAALPASVAANWLAAAWDQDAGLRVMAPSVAVLEDVVLDWVRDLLGLPAGCGGSLVTGATMANFCGLAAARHALLAAAGWNVEEDGLFGAPPLTVVVGEEVHVSMQKALALLGLGRNRVVRVPVDGQGRMRADRVPPLDPRTILCLQAGNVNTGAFDPAAEICPKAREAGAWLHVDGAFGLWAKVSPKYRHLVAGFEQADSWATDAHKWPNTNYDCGISIVRNPFAIHAAMTMNAAYLHPGALREPAQHTPEMSRRARGVEVWAVLRSLGRSGIADLIERTCRHAARFAKELKAEGFEIFNEVVINQVLVGFGSPEVTREVIRRIQQDGTCWCGGTEWQGHTALRISVSSWATTDEDVDTSLASIIRIARKCKEDAMHA
jgi:glutamate/tyrosine decarboxylase-like PLP-dependent enzyme